MSPCLLPFSNPSQEFSQPLLQKRSTAGLTSDLSSRLISASYLFSMPLSSPMVPKLRAPTPELFPAYTLLHPCTNSSSGFLSLSSPTILLPQPLDTNLLYNPNPFTACPGTLGRKDSLVLSLSLPTPWAFQAPYKCSALDKVL